MSLYTDYNTANRTDVDYVAINNSIRNILLTPMGSLPGKPTFGSRINEVPFNQLDHITKDLLENLITEAIMKWETRIQIISVSVEFVEEYNKVTATVNYTYTDQELNKSNQISLSLMT